VFVKNLLRRRYSGKPSKNLLQNLIAESILQNSFLPMSFERCCLAYARVSTDEQDTLAA
jgi:hypothetical protein